MELHIFCPNCKAEYREGFTRCADCEVDLVDKLPEEKNDEFEIDPDINFVEILRSTDLIDIAFIKGMLDSAGIHYFIKGDMMRNIRPVDPAVLMVVEDEAEEAIKILNDLKLSYGRFIFKK